MGQHGAEYGVGVPIFSHCREAAYPDVLDEAENLHHSGGSSRRAVVSDDVVMEVGVHPLTDLLTERRYEVHAFH